MSDQCGDAFDVVPQYKGQHEYPATRYWCIVCTITAIIAADVVTMAKNVISSGPITTYTLLMRLSSPATCHWCLQRIPVHKLMHTCCTSHTQIRKELIEDMSNVITTPNTPTILWFVMSLDRSLSRHVATPCNTDHILDNVFVGAVQRYFPAGSTCITRKATFSFVKTSQPLNSSCHTYSLTRHATPRITRDATDLACRVTLELLTGQIFD